jgi:hypothetical protein
MVSLLGVFNKLKIFEICPQMKRAELKTYNKIDTITLKKNHL